MCDITETLMMYAMEYGLDDEMEMYMEEAVELFMEYPYMDSSFFADWLKKLKERREDTD